MTKTITLPNGETSTTACYTPNEIEALLQTLAMQLLGIAIPPIGATPSVMDAAYRQVRVGWQLDSQPTWDANEDVCFVKVTPMDVPAFGIRSSKIVGSSEVQTYTAAWTCVLVFYGPNSGANAQSMYAGLLGNYGLPYLTQKGIYVSGRYNQPVRAPEEFSQQTWDRSDLTFELNAKATLTIATGFILSADETIIVQP